MSVIKKGQTEAVKSPDLEFIPNVGIRTTLRKDFMSIDSATAFARQLYAQGYRASRKQRGEEPIWTVEASIEGDPTNPDSDLQNTHELRINVGYPDWKTNRYTQSKFTGSPAASSMAYIERRANAIKSDDVKYQDVIDDLIVDTNSPIQPADYALSVELLDELLLGADSFLEFNYVYIHTFNFGTISDLTPDHFGVKQIFTTGGVIADEGTPAALSLPALDWVKLPPERTIMHGARTTLKYEYWGADHWSTNRYPLAGV